jgi:glucose/arabinose dehydrogenase
VALAALLACGPDAEPPIDAADLPPAPDGPAALKRVYRNLSGFAFPTALAQPPGDPEHWYLLEQEGRVRRFRNDSRVSEAPVVLDITSRIVGPDRDWEAGLLGIAFHPRFASNRQVFLFYTAQSETSPVGSKIVLSRFSHPAGANAIDVDSERVLLELECGVLSYNAGTLVFGPDGMLYVSVGQNVARERSCAWTSMQARPMASRRTIP